MQGVLQDFEERVKEIEQFLDLLRLLERPGASLGYQTRRGERTRPIEAAWLKTLKASTFLLLYNLVESATRRGIGAIYERLGSDHRRYDQLVDKIRRVWVNQQFRRMDRWSASPKNYRDTAHDILERVAGRVFLELDDDFLPLSGTLDADKVRKVCQLHDIPVRAHYRASGGTDLHTVMEQRNHLAHGNISFAECGRQYTVDELQQIKQQVVVFMRSILRNIAQYIKKQSYAA